ncbi:MAG: DUF378 domain-containing protein [Candidatus Paceibacterota bacterium]
MKIVHIGAFILLIVGGLNWGLQGLFGWEIGSLFGGMDQFISRAIYVLVGVAAVVELATHKGNCIPCSPNGGMKGSSSQSQGGSDQAM